MLWILQVLLAAVFLFSGFCKTFLPERKLVKMGQTGVENLQTFFIKFIGISEILGSVGLVLPTALNAFTFWTPVAAGGLGLIMPFAAIIHYRRGEPKGVITNVVIFLMCIIVMLLR